MPDEKSRFTLRVSQELLDKFGYIAEYEGRTKKQRAGDSFEKEHGPIAYEKMIQKLR